MRPPLENVGETGREKIVRASLAVQCVDGLAEEVVVDVVAGGPVPPGFKGVHTPAVDIEWVLDGVELAGGVVVVQVVVCFSPLYLGLAVEADGGFGSLTGAFEVGVGVFQSLLGDLEVMACGAAASTADDGEAMLGDGVATAGVVSPGRGVSVGVTVGPGRDSDIVHGAVCGRDSVLQPLTLRHAARRGVSRRRRTLVGRRGATRRTSPG